MGFRLWEKYVLVATVVFLTVLVISLISFSSRPLTINGDSESAQLSRDIVARKAIEERWAFHGFNSSVGNADVEKQEFVKQMMKFSWENYRKYAWGSNELRPISKMGHSGSVFGAGRLGATIVDAIDTLYVMGLSDEYNAAKQFITEELDLKSASRGDLSVFETNIRFVGGLLAIHALTGEEAYLTKAKSVADLLLPAFDTPTGIPLAIVNTRTGKASNWGWASGGCSILSEFGSLELEFNYLSRLTGDDTYAKKIKRIREVVSQVDKPEGLYPNYINPSTGKWCLKHVSVGALGDSFYEYLLKQFIISGKTDLNAKKLYDDAIEALENHLLYKSAQHNLWYFAEMRNNRIEHKMDHLACFIAGLFALQSSHEPTEERKKSLLGISHGNWKHLSRELYPIRNGYWTRILPLYPRCGSSSCKRNREVLHSSTRSHRRMVLPLESNETTKVQRLVLGSCSSP